MGKVNEEIKGGQGKNIMVSKKIGTGLLSLPRTERLQA